ncbi:unnamed protein product [Rhodiola kirilowii]
MALVTHQLQGSFCTAPSKPLSWGKGIKLRQNGVSFQVGLANVRSLNRCSLRLSVDAPRNFFARRKFSKISAFKGNAQPDESESRASSSKPASHSVKLSYAQETNEETPVKSFKAQNVPLSYASEVKDSVVGLPTVHKLFKKWLTVLVSQSPSGSAEGFLEGRQTEIEIPEIQNVVQEKGRGKILKAAWGYFLGLDATIKLPLLIFVPFYLAVTVVYGTKVARELTPLWVMGPLIVALYVKLARLVVALYIFTFKMTVVFLKNSPSYLQTAYAFIARGGIQAAIYACFFKPFVDIKNTDFKQLVKQKQKQYQEWSSERFLDFAEAIWPFYCRTIRFLKRANLI